MLRRAWGVVLCQSAALVLSVAQTHSAPQQIDQAAKAPAYDVTVVRLNKSGSGSSSTDSSTAIYKASNVSIKTLLQDAYGIRKDLISGVPSTVDSARFDFEAKVVDPDMKALGSLSEDQSRGMLRETLIDRFQLKAHIETKNLPVYELVTAKHGSKLTPLAEDGKPEDGTTIRGGRSDVKLTAKAITTATFANSLTNQVDRTVIDKTGLSGKYDFSLQWVKDDLKSTDSGPSIFTALAEQLGLKLQPAKGPVDTLVVDHAEMPSEN